MSDNAPDDVRILQGKAPYSAIAREALKVIADLQAQLDNYQLRNADLAGLNVDLQQKLDAKDTEIARMYGVNQMMATNHAEQIAERDATIARQAEENEAMKAWIDKHLGAWPLKEPNT